jgi:hypothetical protein
MRRQTHFTPDPAAQVRCALDMLRTALAAGPDIDDLTAAAGDWAEDVAHSDATEVDKAQCQALAWSTDAMFRLLAAHDKGLGMISVTAPGFNGLFFEFDRTGPNPPDIVAGVENAVRTALGKAVHA